MKTIRIAFSEKESLSVNIGIIQSRINKLFTDRKSLKEIQAVTEDFHEADAINDELSQMGEFANKYAGFYSIQAEPFHNNLTRGNAVKNLDTLKRHAV